MNDFTACMIVEGVDEASERRRLEAWAHLIKTGAAWSLQGCYGRAAADLIERGIIAPDGEINENHQLIAALEG